MAWFIEQGVNNGYPALNTWRDSWQTGWTSNGKVRYPDYMWRIKQGINNGYPWIYPWFKESAIDTGELVIGGSQSNYPSGFTNANHGGSFEDEFDGHSRIGRTGGQGANIAIISALSNKAFVITGAELNIALNSLNDSNVITSSAIELISKIYGANVFDCFISCKTFPINLGMFTSPNGGGIISGSTAEIKAFGQYTLTDPAHLLASSVGSYQFNTIEINPLQAWQIENIEYSIYLPMSGVYPLDIRGNSNVDIVLYADFVTGAGEYCVHINGQLVGTYRVMLGADVPLNTNQGRMQANMLTNLTSSVIRGASAIMGAGLGSGVLGNTLNAMNPFTEHYAMSTPSVGSLASMQCYEVPYVTARIPKMFKDGYGYQQTLGFNRSTTYVHLNECSGYVKCKNYKTDIIVATDTEKLEIERLMNEGVFV